MKAVIIGYPRSQFLKPASEYLARKYLPKEIELRYFNFIGDTKYWSAYVADCLETISEKYVIFALDDYLLSGYLDLDVYTQALLDMDNDSSIKCTKLCVSTEQEHEEYPTTTQFCIWDRRFLVKILRQTTTPWDFEITGSKLFKESGERSVLRTCLNYPTSSALSARWRGVKLEGNNEEDINYLKQNGLI